MREEIVDRLGLVDPTVVVRGINRPNLFFEVRRVSHAQDEKHVLKEILCGGEGRYKSSLNRRLSQTAEGPGIIYTLTTAAARETAAWLQEWGIPADYYHGRRRKSDRTRVQEAFMSGRIRVVAATSAFGLGVDKQDVRFVIHRQIPGSIDEYFQEAGRGGRDGNLALCSLLYNAADLAKAGFLTAQGPPSVESVRSIRDLVQDSAGTRIGSLIKSTALSRAVIIRGLDLLERNGLVSRTKRGIRLKEDFDPEALVTRERDRLQRYDRSRIDMMRGYAETTSCRREYILNYFGEAVEEGTCLCDNHALGLAGSSRTNENQSRFRLGDRVQHQALGPGMVEHVEDDTLTVLFDDSGYRTLDRTFVEENGALEAE